ncbi:MAG: hypothetical protein KKE37_02260, partial [Verrucomicrobia bacterium]|nr:hypothetical protein [Verrucomicrobiota bacterium]
MNWSNLFKGIYLAIRLVLGVILLVGLATFLYLSIHGVPKRFVDRWLGQLRSQGYCVTVERIRLDLMEGIVAEQFRAFEDEGQLLPILQADQVTLFLNPLDWFQHQTGLRRLRVYNGLLRLSLVENPAFDDTDAVIVRNVNGVVQFGADAWQIGNLSADLLGLKINAHGIFLTPRPTIRPTPPAKTELKGQSAIDSSAAIRHKNTVTYVLNALTRSQRDRILELVKQLNAVTFSVPPHADIAFKIDTENPAFNEASIRMEGAATRAFGVRFDQWRLKASLKDGRLRLSDANIRQRGQALTVSGSYTFTNRVMDARLGGQILLKDWLILAPPAWRDALSGAGCTINGPIQYDIQVDPAPVEQALDSLHGWISLTQADIRGVQIERGLAEFVIDDHRVLVDPFYAILGQGRRRGTLEGHVNYHLDSGDYEGRVESTLDPCALLPALSSNQADMVRSFESHGKPPFVELDFSGRADRDDSLRISGYAQGSNVSYQAVPVTSFESRISYANGTLACDRLRVIRPEGEVTGRFSDVVEGTVLEIDLASTANPMAIARLIGPEVAAYLDGFYFAGPMRIAARGHLDYGAGALTDVRVEVDGADWGYAPFHVSRCSL